MIINQVKWSIDHSHSSIAFKVKHLMIAHIKGSFKTFDANVYTSGKDFTSAEINMIIDASSITTGDLKRDEHLKGSDFFNIIEHKEIKFMANSIEKGDEDGIHTLWGELTIKGITRPVKLNVEFGGIIIDPWGNERAGFAITGKITRSDWGLTWNASVETGSILVSEEVIISCEVELNKTGQKDVQKEPEPIGVEHKVEPNIDSIAQAYQERKLIF
jgi:polyisoprenoid-binding protein YceI